MWAPSIRLIAVASVVALVCDRASAQPETWSPLASAGDIGKTAGADGNVAGILEDPLRPGCAFVGGSFASFAGKIADYLVHYCATTGVVTPILYGGSGFGLSGPVSALALNGSTLFVGGGFIYAGGVNGLKLNGLAGYQIPSPPNSPATGSWFSLNGPFDPNGRQIGVSGSVLTLRMAKNDLVIGGSFGTCGNQQANNLCVYRCEGGGCLLKQIWYYLGNTGTSGSVLDNAVDNSGPTAINFICGAFLGIGGSPGISAYRVGRVVVGANTMSSDYAALSVTTGTSTSYGLDGTCYSIVLRGGAAFGKTELFVAGIFSVAGTVTQAGKLVKITVTVDSIGRVISTYSALTPAPAFTGTNQEAPMWLLPSKLDPSVIYISGSMPRSFASSGLFGGVEVNGLALLMTNTSTIIPLVPTGGAVANAGVQTSACSPAANATGICTGTVATMAEIGGSIWMGGKNFQFTGGNTNAPFNNLAIWTPNTAIGPFGLPASGPALPGTSLMAQGSWASAGSGGNGVDAVVYKLVRETDLLDPTLPVSSTDTLLVAGAMTFAGGAAARGIARWTPSTSTWSSAVNPQLPLGLRVTTIARNPAATVISPSFFIGTTRASSSPPVAFPEMPIRRCSASMLSPSGAPTYSCDTLVGTAGTVFGAPLPSSGSPSVSVMVPLPDGSGRYLVGGQFSRIYDASGFNLPNATALAVFDPSGQGGVGTFAHPLSDPTRSLYDYSYTVPSVACAIPLTLTTDTGLPRPVVLIGGTWTKELGSGQILNNIAFYDPANGGSLFPFRPVNSTSPGFAYGVTAFGRYGTLVYIGLSYISSTYNYIAQWSITNNIMTPLTPIGNTLTNNGLNGPVLDIAVDQTDGTAFFAGSFTMCMPSMPCSGVVKWSKQVFTPLQTLPNYFEGVQRIGVVNSLTLLGKRLFLGGRFASASRTELALNIVSWDSTLPSPTPSATPRPTVSTSLSATITPSKSFSQSVTATLTPTSSVSPSMGASLSSTASNNPSRLPPSATGSPAAVASVSAAPASQSPSSAPASKAPASPSAAAASVSPSATATSQSPSNVPPSPSNAPVGSSSPTMASSVSPSTVAASPSTGGKVSPSSVPASPTSAGGVSPSAPAASPSRVSSRSATAPSASQQPPSVSASHVPAASTSPSAASTQSPLAPSMSPTASLSMGASPSSTASASPSPAAALLVSVQLRLDGASLASLLRSGSTGGTLFALKPIIASIKSFLVGSLVSYYPNSGPATFPQFGIILTKVTDRNDPTQSVSLSASDPVNLGLMPSAFMGVQTIFAVGGRRLQSTEGVTLQTTVALPTDGLQRPSSGMPLDSFASNLVTSALALPGASALLSQTATSVASSVGISAMTAAVVAVAPEPPANVPSSTPSPASAAKSSNTGAIVGGILAAVFIICIAAGVYFFVLRPRKQQGQILGGNKTNKHRTGYRASSVADSLAFSVTSARNLNLAQTNGGRARSLRSLTIEGLPAAPGKEQIELPGAASGSRTVVNPLAAATAPPSAPPPPQVNPLASVMAAQGPRQSRVWAMNVQSVESSEAVDEARGGRRQSFAPSAGQV